MRRSAIRAPPASAAAARRQVRSGGAAATHVGGGDHAGDAALAVQPCPYPIAFSIAWPNVWPKLSSARSPCSRSSAATIPALIRQLSWIACAGRPARATSAVHARLEPRRNRASRRARRSPPPGRPAKLARGQRAQAVGVDQDSTRLVEAPIMFLPRRVVDAGLAAHRRVDLREQRRGHLHERHAALVDRGRESRHVADDASAQRDQRGRALGAQLEQARDACTACPSSCAPRRPGSAPPAPRCPPPPGSRTAARAGGRRPSRWSRRPPSRRRAPRAADRRDARRPRRCGSDTMRSASATSRTSVTMGRPERPAGAEHERGSRCPCRRAAPRFGPAPPSSATSNAVEVDPHIRRRHPGLEQAREAHHLAALGADDVVGRLAVQRIALRVQLGQPPQRIGRLQQRTVAAVARALRAQVATVPLTSGARDWPDAPRRHRSTARCRSARRARRGWPPRGRGSPPRPRSRRSSGSIPPAAARARCRHPRSACAAGARAGARAWTCPRPAGRSETNCPGAAAPGQRCGRRQARLPGARSHADVTARPARTPSRCAA